MESTTIQVLLNETFQQPSRGHAHFSSADFQAARPPILNWAGIISTAARVAEMMPFSLPLCSEVAQPSFGTCFARSMA